MSVELRPLGVACNLACRYCYQEPQREGGNVSRPLHMHKMKESVEKIGGSFVLFGGEPLLLSLDRLEEIWSWGFERTGRNSVQTNGTLITDAHMALFERYNVEVGISMDGPDELNDTRWARSTEATRAATARSQAALETLARSGRPPGLIVTLHRANATTASLPRMAAWFRDLDALGLRNVRLHILEVDSAEVRAELALSEAENVEALRYFAGLQAELRNVRFDVVQEMQRLMRGADKQASCVWRGCDPYTTPAVQGVEGDGHSSNCGRVNKDGVDFTKADHISFERYLMLYQTPQEYNGCANCRFFLLCKGQCPGTAVDGDWRNRTEHCGVWMALFELLEAQAVQAGETPFSLRPDRVEIEERMVEEWLRGRNTFLADLIDTAAGVSS